MADNELRIGLEGVAIAETEISHVDGEKGKLIYRGHFIEELARNYPFEAIAYLLWYGNLPSENELDEFKAKIRAKRELPTHLKQIIEHLPKDMPMMQVIRTLISAIHIDKPWPPTPDQALEVFAKVPTIITHYYHYANGNRIIPPHADLDHAANYLYMLHGKESDQAHVRALETYMIISLEHGMNASTFTSRVVTGTEENIVGALSAAVAALEGPLHGGAPSKVDDMLEAIGSIDNAEPWLRNAIESGQRLMGFGHRVYKTYDPRAAVLKEVTEELASENNPLFQLALHVEKLAIKLLEEYKPGRNLYPNLEFWTAGVLRTVELPSDLYTATFCASRVAGWSAHIMEQAANNRLIRPSSIYVGPYPKE